MDEAKVSVSRGCGELVAGVVTPVPPVPLVLIGHDLPGPARQYRADARITDAVAFRQFPHRNPCTGCTDLEHVGRGQLGVALGLAPLDAHPPVTGVTPDLRGGEVGHTKL